MSFIQNNAAILIAGIAVILSCVSNWRLVKLERENKSVKKSIRRMDILVEIEQQHAVTGKLALVLAKSMCLIQENPHIIKNPDDEIKRLRKNIDATQVLKDAELEQRTISEQESGNDDVIEHGKALTDVKRLRVRMEGELDKQTTTYNELLELSKVKSG